MILIINFRKKMYKTCIKMTFFDSKLEIVNYLVNMIFLLYFQKIIVRYKKIGYNINVLRQTAYLVVNPIKVNNFTRR